MKLKTRLHDVFHPMIKFHITGWKISMRVSMMLFLFSGLSMAETNPLPEQEHRAEANGSGTQQDCASLYESQRYTQALPVCLKAATAGDRKAQHQLALMYGKGLGVPLNLATSAKWYKASANNGSAAAQCQLGRMYAKGKGVNKNSELALGWFRKAADQHFAQAQYVLGVIYQSGLLGIKKDDVKAVGFYRLAAEQGLDGGQNNLAVMYQNGFGVNKDVKAAAYWFKKAADQDFALAQRNMGYIYSYGVGVKRNRKEARKWYIRAANSGDQFSKRLIKNFPGVVNVGVIYPSQHQPKP